MCPYVMGGKINKSQRVLNKPLRVLMGKMRIKEKGHLFRTIVNRGKVEYLNSVSQGICEKLFAEMEEHTKDTLEVSLEEFYSWCLKRYNPYAFLNGIDDLRTTLKEMKDHGTTKEEQEGRNQGSEKDS